jgi:adenylate kinase
MEKKVIIITGTPGVGKTTVALKLANRLNAEYINLTDLAKREQLEIEKDEKRETTVINEQKMRRKLRTIIEKSKLNLIIDGHYASAVTPKALVNQVFVLRRHPSELSKFLKNRGYSSSKIEENIAAEILDVCLGEALGNQTESKVFELDITGKTADFVLEELLAVIEGRIENGSYCKVDWLGKLEKEGKLDNYLKT